MRKLIFFIVLCLLSVCAFADHYPFSMVVFPAGINASIGAGPAANGQVTEVISKAINSKPSLCALCFNKENGMVKKLAEEGVLEESDLVDAVPFEDCERISSSMDADGYCIVYVKSFSNDTKALIAEVVVNVKIYKNGVDKPIFDQDVKGRYDGFKGYWKKATDAKVFENSLYYCRLALEKKLAKLNGYEYKDYRKVELVLPEE